MPRNDTILIIGGSGKTGARVDTLKARSIPTRPVSRSSTISFNWTKRETWPATLADVSKAYVTYQPDLAVDGADDDIAELSRIAREEGLEHLVPAVGAGRARRTARGGGIAGIGRSVDHRSGKLVQPEFLRRLSARQRPDWRSRIACRPVPEPFIDADDIADVAFAALTDDLHKGKLYEVTGPRALTFAEAIDEIAKAAGRSVRCVQISPEQFVEQTRPYVPEDILDLLNELFTVVLDGRNVEVVHGVEEAIGRKPIDFAEYARRTAATGVWEVALLQ